jgi:hypothetical protein
LLSALRALFCSATHNSIFEKPISDQCLQVSDRNIGDAGNETDDSKGSSFEPGWLQRPLTK